MHIRAIACIAAFAPSAFASAQISISDAPATVVIDRGLTVSGVAESARRPINTDLVVANLIHGTLNLKSVRAGDEFAPGKVWSDATASGDGFPSSGRSTYVLTRVLSAHPAVMILEASGHAMVYVNDEPRVGDPYGHGYVALPILLHEGENTLLFAHAGRGGLKATLRKPDAQASLLTSDLTLPDVSRSQPLEAPVGVPIMNASNRERIFTLMGDAGAGTTTSAEFRLPPATVLKACVRVRLPMSDKPVILRLSLTENGTTIASCESTLVPPSEGSPFKLTYESRVDGSVQYASVVPQPTGSATPNPALVLSLHGASVEATNQAASYAPREGYIIVCPTNRRPFGFDWEDWGRIDALEVMDLAKQRFKTDAARQYLTGHSMGGHGTWNIGTLYPDRFAAIAPSAGWLSFETYMSRGGPAYAPAGPMGDLFRAARDSSDTPKFMSNLKGKGIYILHGDADDNVPVDQARQARTTLDQLKIPYASHEQAGAGHWWDDDKPGAACLDWPGIWDTFAANRLEPDRPKTEVQSPLDDRGFAKGSFKRVFDHHFVLVYATGGTPEENAWSIAKARFDAELWWYRGNGHAPVLSDAQFLASPTAGNVVLYGNSHTHRAWTRLVGNAKLELEQSRLSVAGHTLAGDDLALLAVVPRADTNDRVVGIIGGTGRPGMRACDRLSYFTSGVGFPNVTILRADIWRDGFSAVAGAGDVDAMLWQDQDTPK